MKLAFCNPAVAAPEFKPQNWTDVRLCLEQCQADLGRLPPGAAKRLGRMFKRFARALDHGADDLAAQARQLEENVAFIGAVMPSLDEPRRLQRHLTRLLHEIFRTPEWRRGVIAGL